MEPSLGSVDRDNREGLALLKNVAEDQKVLWIVPKHLRFWGTDWPVPLWGATAAVLATAIRFNVLCFQHSACSRDDSLVMGGRP